MNAEQQKTLQESKEVLDGARSFNVTNPLGKGLSSRYAEILWEAMHLKGGGHVLDVGFSLSSQETVGVLLYAQEKGLITLEGVDIIPPEKVINRYPEEWRESISNIPVVVGDVRTLDLPKEKYDMVTCISVIEHIGYDTPSTTVEGSSFERSRDKEGVQTVRDPRVNRDVLSAFHMALKPGGKALLTVPMGKGGPVLLQDSLDLYCAEWEYEKNSWEEITKDDRFTLAEELFFKNTEEGWVQVASPEALSEVHQTTSDRDGVGVAFCILVKK